MVKKIISYADFVKGNFKQRYAKKEHPVLVLLRDNKKAYTVEAICEKTKLKKETTRSMLRKLKQAKLVVHKQPFFAYKHK